MNNNNMYPRGYIPSYQQNYPRNSMYEQNMYEQIDNQISQLQGMKNQIRNNNLQSAQNQQPTSINQTFQLAPNGVSGIKYVNSIEEVAKETIFVETPFFSKDMSVLWVKKPSNEIKAYELKEIIERDEKDIQIELLRAEINELKGMIKDEQSNSNVNEKQNATDTETSNVAIREPAQENQPTSVSRISTSKKKQH